MLKKLLCALVLLVASAPAAFAANLSSMSWDQIVAQAKQEGEVSWFVWYFEDRFRPFVQKFTDETGIKVTIPDGDHDTNIAKAVADASRAKGDIDVLAYGWDRIVTIPNDLFIPLTALPKDDSRVSKLIGIDGGGKALAFWGNQTGVAYDPAKITESDLPQNPDQFAAFWQAHPGQFGFNYENGGSGPSFYRNMVRVLTGLDLTDGTDTPERRAALKPAFDFFNKYAADYEITASNADSLTRLSQGEFTMVAAWEDHLAGLQVSGEVRKDLKFYIPEMGMDGGGNAVSIPANAPHPAAALVFMNWLTSADVQTEFNKQFGTAPMNKNADDSAALVSMKMRERQVPAGQKPFIDTLSQLFIEDVIQER